MEIKTKEKEIAVTLRKSGESIIEIAKKLKVSKSSVFLWTKKVKLSKDQLKNLVRRKIVNGYRKKLGDISKRRKLMGEGAWQSYQEARRKKNNGKLTSSWWSKRRIEIKKELVEYKGGRCTVCGYTKCFAALDFHHRDPKEKEFSIAKTGYSNLDKLKKEVDKCDLLCKNCHTEVHYLKEIE